VSAKKKRREVSHEKKGREPGTFRACSARKIARRRKAESVSTFQSDLGEKKDGRSPGDPRKVADRSFRTARIWAKRNPEKGV